MESLDVISPQYIYLNAAIQTVKYVDTKMDIGSSNKFGNSYYGFPARYLCVAESRSKIVDDLKKQGPDIKRTGADPLKAMVDTWASWSRFYGCGNCGEQSALAFVQLRDVWKVFPLDWMQYGNFTHGFVVLGRIGATNPAKIETWNPEAVICDPWRGEALPASAVTRHRGQPIDLIYRQAVAL